MDKRTEYSYFSVDIRKLIMRKIVNLGGDTDTSFSSRGAHYSS